jgi:hypothetical protein
MPTTEYFVSKRGYKYRSRLDGYRTKCHNQLVKYLKKSKA